MNDATPSRRRRVGPLPEDELLQRRARLVSLLARGAVRAHRRRRNGDEVAEALPPRGRDVGDE